MTFTVTVRLERRRALASRDCENLAISWRGPPSWISVFGHLSQSNLVHEQTLATRWSLVAK